MKCYKINAFVPLLMLPNIEEELKLINAPGITISKVKGYGEHMNFYSSDWMETHGRIEIFCHDDCIDSICTAIKKGVGLDDSLNGFIAIMPVERMFPLTDLKVN